DDENLVNKIVVAYKKFHACNLLIDSIIHMRSEIGAIDKNIKSPNELPKEQQMKEKLIIMYKEKIKDMFKEKIDSKFKDEEPLEAIIKELRELIRKP
ncbi:MAG: hypothetical protein JW871_06605, partial [Endomicrobiales bacterium]|nr:hypothetical protein [Endomicrobiales bacterium]